MHTYVTYVLNIKSRWRRHLHLHISQTSFVNRKRLQSLDPVTLVPAPRLHRDAYQRQKGKPKLKILKLRVRVSTLDHEYVCQHSSKNKATRFGKVLAAVTAAANFVNSNHQTMISEISPLHGACRNAA
jgi:hypothetical protein